MSGVNLYQDSKRLDPLKETWAMTVPSVRSSGLLNPPGAVVTAAHVPPKGGEAGFCVDCDGAAGRCGRCETNSLQAAGLFLKYCSVGTLNRGRIGSGVCACP